MIAVIDYKSGNVLSVVNALKRLGSDYVVTGDPAETRRADGVIFPGQGRIGQAMRELGARGLDKAIASISAPFLGLCLGLQLLGGDSEEDDAPCLNIFNGRSRKLPPTLRTPHLGWNKVKLVRESDLLAGLPDGAYFYFVHSYYLDADGDEVVATTAYGFEFPAVVQKGNFFATQFHPEKSGEQGLAVIKNFIGLCS